MRIDDLSPDTLERLKKVRWDRFIEKHEGPFDWASELRRYDPDDFIYKVYPDYDAEAEYPEFIQIGEHWVLLPIGKKHHPNLTILHYFLSQDASKLVLYLKDTTYYEDGFVAICDRFDATFYVATFYHEWYIIDYDGD
jgi:hypothetical protein